MRILHISRTMGQGGAEKIVYQLCSETDSNNEKIVASTGGFYLEQLNEKGIKHYIIPDIDKKNPFLMIKTFFILMNIVKKEKIDVIHSHHRMAAFYGQLIYIFNKNLKLVYTAHNIFSNKRRLMRFSLKNTKIIAVGQGVYNNLKDFYKINKKNICIIHNSVIPNYTGKKNDLLANYEKKIFIGTIGRLSEQKGIDIFLKSMKNVIDKNKNVMAIVIGDGEDRKNLEELSKELNIKDNTLFLGFQSNIFDLIKQMKFVVLSSRWEGFPLTPIETFSMSKTIIASNIDGNNEIVKDKVNGLLFEKDNINDLSNKILELIDNKQLREKLEKQAFSDFNNYYSYQTFINKYNDMYKKL